MGSSTHRYARRLVHPLPVVDYTADFETTTDPNDCRVWAWATCTIDNVNTVTMGNDMAGFLRFAEMCPGSDFWFHNLSFDGDFIINHLLHEGWIHVDKITAGRQFTTLISSMGKFYQIELCFSMAKRRGCRVKFKDSLKKLTMSVDDVAKAFKLPISKLEIDYDAPRPVGHILTEEERAYLENDVMIMAMALRQDFDRGLTRLTTGADALANYQDNLGKRNWKKLFPVLPLPMDTAIRMAYRGGWTYANPIYQADEQHQNRIVGAGSVYDKNSMYPSVMYSRPLPVGTPVYFRGRYQNDPRHPLYIQYLVCSLELKQNMLPTLQVKGNPFYNETEYITTTEGTVELAVTNLDLALLEKHYRVDVVEWKGGYMFRAMRGMFCDYIDHWMRIKETTEGGERLRAKLMLNALYGKFATNPDVTPKIPYLREDGSTGYALGEEDTRDPVYTPMGVFITSYARYDIITNCQAIYPRFLYADTDSIHCLGTDPLDLDDVHPTRLGAWKHESDFARAKYVRAKCYMEEVTHLGKITDEGYTMVETDPYIDVKCAGCPADLRKSITFENFKRGLVLYGKLRPKHVKGGIVLEKTDFSLR